MGNGEMTNSWKINEKGGGIPRAEKVRENTIRDAILTCARKPTLTIDIVYF